MTDYFLIVLLALGASFIERTIGFGFGILIMTGLPFLMPSYGEATTLSGLLALTTSIIICVNMRKYIVWRHLWTILISFIFVSAGAIYLLKRIEVRVLWLSLGIVLILISIYFLFFGDRIRIKSTIVSQLVAGAVSGLMGGFFGMQGPPAVLYFVSSESDKNHYVATISTYFCLGNLAMSLFRASNGYLTRTVGLSYLFGIAGVVGGTYLGTIVFDKIPQQAFKYVVYAFIGISGIIVLTFT